MEIIFIQIMKLLAWCPYNISSLHEVCIANNLPVPFIQVKIKWVIFYIGDEQDY